MSDQTRPPSEPSSSNDETSSSEPGPVQRGITYRHSSGQKEPIWVSLGWLVVPLLLMAAILAVAGHG